MNTELRKEIEDYCSEIPFLGFSSQENIKQCKIAYMAYKDKESIEDYKNCAVTALKKNFSRLNYKDDEFDNFWDELLKHIEENSYVIERLDNLNLLKR